MDLLLTAAGPVSQTLGHVPPLTIGAHHPVVHVRFTRELGVVVTPGDVELAPGGDNRWFGVLAGEAVADVDHGSPGVAVGPATEYLDAWVRFVLLQWISGLPREPQLPVVDVRGGPRGDAALDHVADGPGLVPGLGRGVVDP